MANPPRTVLTAKLISDRPRRMEHRLRAAVVQRLQQLSLADPVSLFARMDSLQRSDAVA